MVIRADFVQEKLAKSEEWMNVIKLANSFESHMSEKSVAARISKANQPGSSSSLIQAVLLEHATKLGFRNEALGLFKGYKNRGLRPDYFLSLGDTGVILEIERGKTNQNNMDFLDFWKCHICKHAHYLFLMVPQELKQRTNGAVSKPFNTTRSHLSAFFEEGNYTNVRGLVLFGY